MNVLYTFGFALQAGGHFKSALCMLKQITANGHNAWVAAAPGGIDAVYEEYQKAGAQVVHIPQLERTSRVPLVSGAASIAKLARDHNINIIHAQDFISAGHAYFGAIRAGKSFVYTQAGGPFMHEAP
ncbi:MAG: hypothetical protein KAT30_17095, partial [Candidatus Krumholzibacteria bacterium]|nr:hypothetical protein [Candidatus Krumholzibacteria bacterium]